MRVRALGVALVLLAGACTSPSEPAEPSTRSETSAPSTRSDTSALPTLEVAQLTRWVCRPDLPDNPCTDGLDAEILPIAGGSRAEPFVPAADPPVDCFYVYPTVSDAPGPNAPRRSTTRIEATVRAQAARFGSACRVFAPVYRQATAASLLSGAYFDPDVLARVDRDVRSAWHDYLNKDNDGRGVVLIGHSQGATALQRLLGTEITTESAQRDRIVSALLLGGNVPADPAEDGLVPCEEAGQVSCVVAYSSFASPPPPTAFFGRAGLGPALCTEPSRLADDRSGALRPYLPTERLSGTDGLAVPAPTGVRAGFVGYPGSLTARCRTTDGFGWLDVDAVDGARTPSLELTPASGWGLHVADINLALGDLVEIVRLQGQRWSADAGP